MTSNSRYFDELQSMRGLAALLVVFGHCIAVFSLKPGLVAYLGKFLNGSAAVAFFFVLSGAVLTMSWRSTPVSGASYARYLVRRAFRILPLLALVAIVGTIWCNYLDSRATYPFATAWFTEFYKTDIDLPRFVAALIGYSARPAPPLWSIFVEIMGSLVIPLMIVASRRPLAMLPLGLALLLVGWWGAPGLQYRWPVFLINFYLGVTILGWGPGFARRAGRLPRPLVLAVVLAGLVLALGNRHWWPAGHGAFGSNLIEMAVAAPIIALAAYSPGLFPILHNRVLVHIGDISYSIYLVHFLIMVALVQAMARLVPAETIAAHADGAALLLVVVVTCVTLVVSSLTYRWFEMPLTVLGKHCLAHGQRLLGSPPGRAAGEEVAVAARLEINPALDPRAGQA